MNGNFSSDDFAGGVRVLQIIVVALILGVVCFAGVVISMQGIDLSRANQLGVFTTATLAMAAGALLLQRIVFSLLRSQLCTQLARRDDAEPEQFAQELAAGLQTRTIVAAAICEGAAFANLVAYMQDRNICCFAAAMVLVAAMAALFPTAGRYAEALRQDLRRVTDERSLRR